MAHDPAPLALLCKRLGLLMLFALAGCASYFGEAAKHRSSARMSSERPSSGLFAERLLGSWRPLGGNDCALNVTLGNDALIFTIGGQSTRHRIDSDKPLETRTHVVGLGSGSGHDYVLTPEFFATSDARSFNLVIEEKAAGTRDVWAPCEGKP